jgi:3'(2'), 5'-bisphosphate nucleotidase
MERPDPMLAPLLALAARAADEIMAVYGTEFTVDVKADDSPLTEADARAHRVLCEGLVALTPDIPVLSEESAAVPWAERQRWGTYWLVDPLDGTKEFVKRNGEFTVNVALIERGRPIVGVVHLPATGVAYCGTEGVGAWKRVGAGPLERIGVQRPAAAPPRVVASRSHRGEALDAWLVALGPHEIVSVGSSLKFCVVAEGGADLYPRLGPTMEWDTAAGQCVAECAGAQVLDAAGAPLRYNRGESLLNPSFIVIGDPACWTPTISNHAIDN